MLFYASRMAYKTRFLVKNKERSLGQFINYRSAITKSTEQTWHEFGMEPKHYEYRTFYQFIFILCVLNYTFHIIIPNMDMLLYMYKNRL